MSANSRKILIIGGRGALGHALVRHFKSRNEWVASVDHGENEQADLSITISPTLPLTCSEQVLQFAPSLLNFMCLHAICFNS